MKCFDICMWVDFFTHSSLKLQSCFVWFYHKKNNRQADPATHQPFACMFAYLNGCNGAPFLILRTLFFCSRVFSLYLFVYASTSCCLSNSPFVFWCFLPSSSSHYYRHSMTSNRQIIVYMHFHLCVYRYFRKGTDIFKVCVWWIYENMGNAHGAMFHIVVLLVDEDDDGDSDVTIWATKLWEIMCRLLASLRLFSWMTLNFYEWKCESGSVNSLCLSESVCVCVFIGVFENAILLWSQCTLKCRTCSYVGCHVRSPINILPYCHFNRALCMRYLWFKSEHHLRLWTFLP